MAYKRGCGLGNAKMHLSFHAAVVMTVCAISLSSFAPNAAQAQDYLTQTGSPTFNSPEPVEQGFTDAANGNLHLEWLFGSYPQRGSSQPYMVRYVYDSNIWTVGCSASSCGWWANPGDNYGWRLATDTGTLTGLNCGTYCTEWQYTDAVGTSRYFPVSGGTCPVPNAYASDSSGYMLNICQTGVYAPDGTLVYSAPYQEPQSPGAEDSNGNYITWDAPSTDTVGRSLPTIVTDCNGNSSETCYEVPNSQGGTSIYTVTTSSIPVSTNFGQSGVTEYTGNITVVTKLALPDGTSYTFLFDCNSGTGNLACGSPSGQSGYYGVLTSMTLPTGGTVTYGYTTFSDSYSNKTRWLTSRISAGGVFTYTPAVVSTCSSTQVGCQQEVTVKKPNGASTVYTFTLNNGAWPVQIQFSGSSTLLATVNNTYDFSNACPFVNCYGAAYIRLLTMQTTVPIYEGNIEKQTTYQYDSYLTGNVTVTNEWGYYYAGAGQASFPSTPDRETYVTYLTTGTNDIDRPASVALYDHGSQISQTLYTYDSYAATCPGGGLKGITGMMNHDDTNFGSGYIPRGNLTKTQRLVSGSTYLTTQYCYDSTGQVTKKTDPDGNVTTYGYGDSFYSDNGANPPTSYTPGQPTNAYLTSLTQPLIGTSASAYYYGSGKQAFATDPSAVSAYFHFVDPFDRPTERDYPVCGTGACTGTAKGSDKTAYTSATQTNFYLTTGEHREVVLDDYGRKSSETVPNYPGGAPTVNTAYDASGRVYTVSHAYTSGSTEVYETYLYDALDRTTQDAHPDGEYLSALYGTAVYPNGNGVGSQQGSTTTYGWGYPVLTRDETGQESQEWHDGFGRIIEVDEATSTTATPGTGSVGISGTEQSTQIYTCQVVGQASSEACYRTIWDIGTASITVNGFVASVSYGEGSTDASIATSLASGFNNNSNSPVTATASNSTVSLTSKTTGAISNYSLSATSKTNDPTYFGNGSFSATASGSELTGGYNAAPTLQSPTATFYKYDAAGHVTQVVQGLQTRTFAYDGLGRPTSVTTPEAGAETRSYTTSSGGLCSGDPVNVCQKSDARGVVTNYFYDALNRLVGKSYTIPSGSNVSAMPNVCTTSTGQSANVCYTYDQGGASAYSLGRRTQMLDPSGSESYAYDAAGRLKQLTKIIGTTSYMFGYQYNAGNEVTQITYPSGRVLQQSYNAVGQVCEVATSTTGCGTSSSPFSTAYAYDASANITGLKFGNGVTATYSYSLNREQLSALSYANSSTTLFALNYLYQQSSTNCPTGNTIGDNGQIQCIADSVSSGRTVSYTYDFLGRLSTATSSGSSSYPQWGLSETYDRYGNRWSQTLTAGTGPSSSISFSSSGGALTNHPDGWCFDASGNLLAKTGDCPPAAPNFVYDGENRMVGDPTAGATYVYDGNGNRVQKCLPNCTNPISSVGYLFSGSHDVAEYDNGAASSSPSSEFIYSDVVPGSGLIASIVSGTTTYFQSDHLAWRVSTNTSGQILGQQGTFPFGESWYSSDPNEFVFTGYQRDAESGLDYAMARYYDSTVGRFGSADPRGGGIADPQSLNRYTYVRNDPIDLTDPSGKSFLSWFELVGSLVADFLDFGSTTPETVDLAITQELAQETAGLATVGSVMQAGEETSPKGQQSPESTNQGQNQTPADKPAPQSPPVGPDGKLAPPPVPVPGAIDLPWKWNPDGGNPRGGTWGPDGWKGPNPPAGSWDPDGHWDIDNGDGARDRYDPQGNPITPDQAHPGNAPTQQTTLWDRIKSITPGPIVRLGTTGIVIYIIIDEGSRLYPPRNLVPVP
jgi:RHS repeat-associated protein